ncbi:hypothetical protein C0J52_25395 [Blattella germanica]|nr:hypothetical protein C0J52_25395 [Blattella germanica]
MFVRYWRLYAYVHLPFLICIGYIWLLIESPRWLNMKRKEEKLKRKLITIAKCKGFTYTKEDLEKFRVNVIKFLSYVFFFINIVSNFHFICTKAVPNNVAYSTCSLYTYLSSEQMDSPSHMKHIHTGDRNKAL